MKKQNGAEKTCAIFLPEIGLEKGFSTASTFELTGLSGFFAGSLDCRVTHVLFRRLSDFGGLVDSLAH